MKNHFLTIVLGVEDMNRRTSLVLMFVGIGVLVFGFYLAFFG